MKLTNFVVSFVFIFFIALSVTLFFTKNKIDSDKDLNKDEKTYLEVNDDINLLNNPYDQNRFYLLFDNFVLNTKNFVNVFSFFKNNKSDFLIRNIIPYDNPSYSDALEKYNDGFTFMNSNLDEGINFFYNKYVEILKNNNLTSEIEKVNSKGIEIRIVEIDALNIDMYNFLNKYDSIKFSLLRNGNYQNIHK